MTLKSTLFLKVGSDADEWDVCDAFGSSGSAQPETGFAGSALLSGFGPRAGGTASTSVLIDIEDDEVTALARAPVTTPPPSSEWTCSACTFNNELGATKCSMCGAPRDSPSSTGRGIKRSRS